MFKKIKIQGKIILGYAVILVILIVISLMSIRYINNLVATTGKVGISHTYVVISQAGKLIKLLVDMETGERGFLITGTDEFLEPYHNGKKEFKKEFDTLHHTVRDNPAQQSKLKEVLKLHDEWQSNVVSKAIALRRKVVHTTNTDDKSTAITMNDVINFENKKQGKKYMDTMRKIILDFTSVEEGLLKKRVKEQNDLASQAILITVIIAVIGLVLGIIIAFTLTRSITKPLKQAVELLSDASTNVSSGSQQVTTASQKLASGASEQASSLEETTASLEEISAMIQSNSDSAIKANSMVEDTSQIVTTANQSMTKLRESIEEINKSSEETVKIIKVIDEIAFQTNLLALNAAVEAARAGEAGMGFAVVADEVRNLAQRSAEAAKSTAQLIDSSIKKIKEGNDLTLNTEKAFIEVVKNIKSLKEIIQEVTTSSKEQAIGIDQVNNTMASMDQVTQQNAASSEESAAASEEMYSQAMSLLNVVEQLISLVGGSAGTNGNNREKIAIPHYQTDIHENKSAGLMTIPKPINTTYKRSMDYNMNNGPSDKDFKNF